MFLKSGFILNGLFCGTDYSQLTRLAWLAGGPLWVWEMGLEARAKAGASQGGYQALSLPLLCTGCDGHERKGGERAAALRGPGSEADGAAE